MRASLARWAAYELAVQNVEHELVFFDRLFQRHFGRRPESLREDFCGSAAVADAFAQSAPERWAIGVDKDPKALDAARVLHSLEGVTLVEADARTELGERTDLVAAENFSYGVFHERDALLEWMLVAASQLNDEGALVLDVLGGPRFQHAHVDEHEGWRFVQAGFDPITHRAFFRLELENAGCFEYDWRLWSVPELVDAMREVGLAPEVYWAAEDGARSGLYRRRSSAESATGFVAYVAGVLGST